MHSGDLLRGNQGTQKIAGVHAQRDDRVNRQQESGLGRNLTCQHLDFRLPASRTLGKINVFFFFNRFLLLVPLRMRHLVRVTLEKHHHNYNGYSRFGLRAINKMTQGDRTGRLQEELSATGGLRRWLRRGRIYAES